MRAKRASLNALTLDLPQPNSQKWTGRGHNEEVPQYDEVFHLAHEVPETQISRADTESSRSERSANESIDDAARATCKYTSRRSGSAGFLACR